MLKSKMVVNFLGEGEEMMVTNLRKWSVKHESKFYTLNYVMLFLSAFIYFGYAYLTTPHQNQTLQESLRKSPTMAVVLLVVSLEVFAGWYLWRMRSSLTKSRADARLMIWPLMICQLVLGNLVVFVTAGISYLGVTTKSHAMKQSRPSLGTIIVSILLTLLYALCFYLAYQLLTN